MIYQTKSLTGLRDKNEDELDIIINYDGSDTESKEMNFYAIYDGHGGNNISKYIKTRLSKYFMTTSSDIEIGKSKSCDKKITKIYDKLQEKISNLELSSKGCGSTALVVIQHTNSSKSKIYSHLKVINLGDCRAVLCNHNNVALPLTKDHKPMAYDEYNRITQMKGTITHDKDDDPRINGLSVSRSFGDVDSKPHVSHLPEIFDYEMTVKHGEITDKFLILACDGVWDVLSNQEAVDFVLFKLDELSPISTCNLTGRNNIAHLLGKHAIDKGSSDNISIAIIFFN